MKRALLLIPLFAGAIFLVLMLLRPGKPAGPSLPGPHPSESPRRTPPAGDPDHAHDSAPPPPAPAGAVGSIRVRVHAKGQPVAGAKVTIQKEGTDDLMSFETPADGRRVIQGMPPAAFGVGVTHPRYLPKSGHARVEAGKVAEVSLELEEGGRVFGTVTDLGGNPLADTNVVLLLADPPTPLGITTKTDAAGKYLLPPIPVGDYIIRFRHLRFVPLDKPGLAIQVPGQSVEINAQLEVGRRVSGQVVDEKGAPLEGAAVIMGNREVGATAKTDQEGAFTVYGLNDQPLNGSASKAGYGTIYVRGIKPNTENLVIRLPLAGSLTGRIEAADPPEHFAIILSRYEQDLKQVLRVQSRSFTAPPGGAFTLTDVTPGTYWVEVEAEGYECDDRPQVVVASGQPAGGMVLRLRKKN